MSLNYTTYVSSLANLFPVPLTDPGFVAVLPNIIDDAEQRVYRELDPLATITRDASGVTVIGQRGFTLPQTNGRIVAVEAINLFTPAGTVTTRNQLVNVSLDYVNAAWPSGALATALPTVFAMQTDQVVVFGPSPDAVYTVEVVGTIRPPPLSQVNPTTYLTLYLPDLFLAASMVFASAYMKNFGAAVDDPRMAQTWETHYQTLFQSANTEEFRKKFGSQGWTSKQPDPIAQPPRS